MESARPVNSLTEPNCSSVTQNIEAHHRKRHHLYRGSAPVGIISGGESRETIYLAGQGRLLTRITMRASEPTDFDDRGPVMFKNLLSVAEAAEE